MWRIAHGSRVRVIRGNAQAWIDQAPSWFLGYLAKYLSVPVQPDEQRGVRFGSIENRAGVMWGSLVHENRVPGGLVPYVWQLAQEYGLPFEVRDVRARPAEPYPWHTMPSMAWRPYQDDVRAAIMEHGEGVIDAPPRCLAGDTKIWVKFCGKAATVPIKQLYREWLWSQHYWGVKQGGKLQGRDLETVLRQRGVPDTVLSRWLHGSDLVTAFQEGSWLVRSCLPSGAITWAPLICAKRSGKRQVYRLVLQSGRWLCATLEHEILTERGMVPLGQLHAGVHVIEEDSKKLGRSTSSAVAHVSPEGMHFTYDLVMGEPHNFVAAGIVVHNSGKTLMAARAIDDHGTTCVYIAPSVSIVAQTAKVFTRLFGEQLVARYDGERKEDLSKPIVVTTAASAVKQPIEWWRTRKMLIVDEFHHGSAETYHRINLLAEHIFYRLCFTGTHFRTGDDALAMHAISSRLLRKIAWWELAPTYLAWPRIFFLTYRQAKPVHVSGVYWDRVYKEGIAECEERNEKVIQTARGLYEAGVPTLVLTRRRMHADLLGKSIPDSVVVKGGEQQLTGKAVQAFNEGRVPMLIGTTVLGEGVDVPRAGAVIYASGGGEGVQMLQSYFRSMTAHEGKPIGRVYDFIDRHHRLLIEHSDGRSNMAIEQFGVQNVHFF